MRAKVPFRSGMIVSDDGNILHAWKGVRDQNNPCEIDQDDGVCVELTEAEYEQIYLILHLLSFDGDKILNTETGKEILKLRKKENPGMTGVNEKNK